MTSRQPAFNQAVLVDTTPLPSSIPPCPEIGATSAPLASASFFIGDRCKAYNDDYMLCKQEASGRGPVDCLKEGRRVTRCAISVIDDLNKHCLAEFRTHWQCLERGNHEFLQCRPEERELNSCVYEKLKLEKEIPGWSGKEPIQQKRDPIYKPLVTPTPKQLEGFIQANREAAQNT